MKAVRFVILGFCLLIAGGLILAVPQSSGSDRYLTHLATDKPIYRTGEEVFVRGVLLRAEGHTPGAEGTANFQIKGPKGDTVASGVARILDSIVGFSWNIPETQAGGEYMVRTYLKPGKHTAVIKMEDGSSMPYSMTVKYYSTLPDSAEQAQIGIRVSLQDRQIQEGSVTEAIVSIMNKSDEAISTPVAIVGIPGGLEVRHDQLKELVKSGKIDAYEVIGREVVLYWRFLKGNAKFDLPLSVVAAVPGSYTGPASRAYLYYTDEYKNWAQGLSVNIAAP